MERLWSDWHPSALVREWIEWWNSLDHTKRLWPAAAAITYWSALRALGGLRGDHFTMAGSFLALYYAGPRLRRVYRFVLPFIATGIVYDSQRFFAEHLRGWIHVDEPYLWDRRYFGILTQAGVVTPNEWFRVHTHPALDFFSGLAYLGYIAEYMLVAAYFFFWKMRSDPRIKMLPWAFLIVNLLGYATYFIYPAAPPWYVSDYGFGPVPPGVRASPAGTLAFDELLGVHTFASIYSRSGNIFGAIPSLHVAYPLIAAYYAYRFKSLRVFTTGFYVLICFSAVYLNHHYVLDVIWGSIFAIAVSVALHWNDRRRHSPHVASEAEHGVLSQTPAA